MNRSRPILPFAIAFFCVMGTATPEAATIVASDLNHGLWRIDTTTGAATLLGVTQVFMTDIAFSPCGELFGISFTDLYRIDPNTAATTHIGSLGVSAANALEFAPDGRLYLATFTGELRTVNRIPGASELVGFIGFTSSGDLAFAPDGRLLMSASSASGQGSDSLVDVNPATGQGCSIGPVASSGIYGLDYVAGMGVVNEQLLGLTNTGQLLSINPTTGAGVVVATTTPTVLAAGAAVLPTPASTGIPAPPFPVILVHGLGSDARTWIPFSSLLCSDGWTFGGTPMIDRATNTVTGTTPGDEYAMNFTDNQTLTFSRQGWELAAMIGAVLAVNPGKDRVVLVGHSMGGLAAREYLQGLARFSDGSLPIPFRGDVSRVITVGTPNRGSEAVFLTSLLAELLGIDVDSEAVKELAPDSEAFATLDDLIRHPLPSTMQYESIIGVGASNPVISDGDGVVSTFSQDLSRVVGTRGLTHEAQSIFITKRPDCGVSNHLDSNPIETHTCEPGDGGVWANILVRVRGSLATPSLGITANKTAFVPGDSLQLDVTEANPGAVTSDDEYLGVLLPTSAGTAFGCPGGDAIVFLANAFTQ